MTNLFNQIISMVVNYYDGDAEKAICSLILVSLMIILPTVGIMFDALGRHINKQMYDYDGRYYE